MIYTPEKQKQLPLDKIETDPQVQPRLDRDDEVIADYAEAMRGGAEFPAIVVFESDGHYVLADGHYRLAAMLHLEPKPTNVKCRVLQGNKRCAMLWAAGANAEHGTRRTNADKRRSVMRLLQDAEWRVWSDRQIAERCHVSHTFVAEIRNELATDSSSRAPEKRKGADGKDRKLPRKKAQQTPEAKARGTVATAHSAEYCSVDENHRSSTDGSAKSAGSTARAGSKVQLFKELTTAITPMLHYWPRAEIVQALREIADNLESAHTEHEAKSA